MSELPGLVQRWPGLGVVLIENQALTTFPADAAHPAARLGQRTLVLPKLDAPLCQLLEQPEFLVGRFSRISVPEDLARLQARTRELLLPVFEQFQALVVAADLGLSVQTLLRRQPRSHS